MNLLLVVCAGTAARPRKVAGSMLHYNCGAAAASVSAESVEPRRMVRHPVAVAYPMRNTVCKSERTEEEEKGLEVPHVVQSKPPQYVKSAAAAAHQGGNH